MALVLSPSLAQPGAAPAQVTAPAQEYFPRCAVHLVVRLDEYGNTGPLRKAAPSTTTKNLNGTQTNRSGLVPQLDPTAPPGVTRYILAPAGQAAAVASNGPQNNTQSTDGLTWDVMAIPDSLTWSQNGLRKAATAKVVLRYVDLPFDPRLARQLAVEVLLGCVDYETAALEASGQWAGQDAPIIPRTYVGPYGEPRTNVRFQGWVDDWKDSWTSDKEPAVELECSDNTQLLIDQAAPPRLVLDMTKPLDLAVAGYLANFVQFAGLTVQYLPQGDAPPVLKDVLSGTAYRPNLGPQPNKAGGASAGTKHSVLDYLTELCALVGHSVRMVGTTVLVQRVRSILTNSTTPRPSDPFQPRTIDGKTYSSRAFIYGANLEELHLRRQFRTHPPQNTEVRCYNPERKTVLVARYPKVSTDPATQKTMVKALPGNTQPDQKWVVVEVAGVKDQATLNRLAQEYYESLGRQELGAEWKTFNLASFGGGNTDADVLDMQFGDTVQFLVDRGRPARSTVNNIERFLTATQKAQQFMEQLGFSSDFAAAYARSYTNAGFQYAFRMHTMTVHWSSDDGCEISGTGVNYVEVRADQVLPPGQEPGNTAMQGAGP